ncbi:MAG: DUF2334 domain-containing protein [Bacteroidota bacterium]|nr:DUF2334 domain-containing protein [Bacteroidota bacterium]
MKKLFVFFLLAILSFGFVSAQSGTAKKVLVLVEGNYDLKSIPSAQGRELVQLLGHFKTAVTINGVAAYKPREIDKYDIVFYVGYSPAYQVPATFGRDVFGTSKQVVWINSGFAEFSKKFDTQKRFGFGVSNFDKVTPFYSVKAGSVTYSKGVPEINIVNISDKSKVDVWATAISSKPKKETPYMLKAGNLVYVADLPFIGATETDRYLFFSDKLHDILGENHAQSHQAIIRIEDVTPMHNPDKLREIADILSERGIPFLVGVVPIYINPAEDRRVTLTDRPEIVDALKYMVRNGGSIVMHGVTHQYKGLSTDDAEFWDLANDRPIIDEDVDAFSKKIEMGLDEFFKNGLFPIAWETPHYMGSIKTYQAVSKFFSTSVEQRMVINKLDYGQYFPYTIQKDLYGQKIYPENLGYIPLSSNKDTSLAYVNRVIKNAEMIHQVRDGIVSFFFHPFLDLDLLKKLTDGIKGKGFKFMNLREQNNWVKIHDKIVMTGSQSYKMNIDNSYLHEVYYNAEGEVIKKSFSDERVKGDVKKSVILNPGEMYFAEGVDYHITEPTFKDKFMQKLRSTYASWFGNKNWREARVSVCWNQYAKGAAYNDQSSLVSIFKSVNINVDTVFIGEDLDLKQCNLLVVPYAYVDSLTFFDSDRILKYVKKGGNLITDRKNKLIEKFGIKFLKADMKLHQIRDKFFPQEIISWRTSPLAFKFDYDSEDEIFCEDASTGLPVVIGRDYGQGKVMYFNTAFDPNSALGYSYYPYALEYVKRYFQVQPVFKRENLEVYFDPSFRKNTSAENLVKLWVKQGIRVIHIGGWIDYKKYTYDYNRLIKLAHANGLLVYAWLEPPYVSEKFWEKHPEWREKNFKNQDLTKASWRFPMALTDSKCLAAVISEYNTFLKKYDWDGVNLAELYFEAGSKGFENDTIFAPMHPSACAEFKRQYGFDLKQIFNPGSPYFWKRNAKAKESVVNYRVNKITWLHEQFLTAFNAIAKSKPGFGVMVTVMDTYFSPELKEYHGISSEKMVELQKKYGFMLQAEDPASKWSTTPDRYAGFGKFYAQKMADPSKLLVDLNIYNLRTGDQVTPFPTLTQTGIESYQLINSAAIGAPRFTIYSEGSCNPQDLSYFSYASSSPVKYEYTDNGYEVNSPVSFILQLPKNIRVIKVDDQSVIGYRENNFIIPAGKHTISIHSQDIPGFSTVELQPQLLSFTGNLLDIKYDMRQVNFTYDSYERALVSLNRKPTSVKIDGKDVKFEVLNGNDCFTLMLPSGKHTVEIITGDQFTYGMNLTSLWSISAIAIYGTLAVILLVLMYFGLKVVRRRLEN